MSSHNDSFVASGSSPTRREEIPSTPDFLVDNHGSIFLLRPQTDEAIAWVDENIGQNSGFRPYWPIVVIEPRDVADIVEGSSAPESFRRFRTTHLRKQRAREGLVQFWLGHAGKSITDGYDRVREDVEYRKEVARAVRISMRSN